MRLLKKGIFTTLLIIGTFFLFSVRFKEKSCFKEYKSPTSYVLTVVVTSLQDKKGRVQLDLYENQKEFESRYSDKERRVYLYKKNAVDGSITYTYKNVPAGIYGLAILDDENSNGRMDYEWLLPAEGYGFGDYWHTKWTIPTFNDFKFNLQSNKTVIIKTKYF